MKIFRVVFSTNRIEFLKKTLESTKMFDYSGLDIHHLFIDDYPLGRNDEFIKNNEKYNIKSACLKTKSGKIMVKHIGDYFQSKRVAENEPGWDNFKYIDCSKKYCSKTGFEWCN